MCCLYMYVGIYVLLKDRIDTWRSPPPFPRWCLHLHIYFLNTHSLSLTHMHPLPNRGPGPPDCITDGEYVQKLCKNHHQSLSIKSILFLFPSIFLGLQTLYTRNRERVFFKADMHISLASAHHWSGLSVKLARGVRRGGRSSADKLTVPVIQRFSFPFLFRLFAWDRSFYFWCVPWLTAIILHGLHLKF